MHIRRKNAIQLPSEFRVKASTVVPDHNGKSDQLVSLSLYNTILSEKFHSRREYYPSKMLGYSTIVLLDAVLPYSIDSTILKGQILTGRLIDDIRVCTLLSACITETVLEESK